MICMVITKTWYINPGILDQLYHEDDHMMNSLRINQKKKWSYEVFIHEVFAKDKEKT